MDRQVLEHTVGPVPADKRKNGIRSRYGKIEVAVSHAFSRPVFGGRTSPYLQEKLVLISTLTLFGQVPKLVEQLLALLHLAALSAVSWCKKLFKLVMLK